MRKGLVRIASFLAGIAALGSAAWAQPFYSFEALNPGAAADTGGDVEASVAVGPDGTIHVVWASTDNYTGDAGTDWDIYYSCASLFAGFSAPILVNQYGTSDSRIDSFPKLAVDAQGVVHCVWQSNSGYAGSGTDVDIVYATKSGATWNTAELVNDAVADNGNPSNSDFLPGLAVRPDGTVVVAWSSNYPTPSGVVGNIGTDYDILYSIRGASGGSEWSAPAPLTSHFAADTGDDAGPVALTLDADGIVVAAWSSNDPLRPVNGKGNDFDIVFDTLSPSGTWGEASEVCALARSDTQADILPSIACVGSGFDREIHVVWASQENYQGAGADWDIFHTILPSLQFLPVSNPAFLVNSTATIDGSGDIDTNPSLCVESGGVVHCVWQSNHNLYGLSGTDIDIFHSANASHGGEWSAADLLNTNGLTDSAGENDELPCMVVIPSPYSGGFLLPVWQSTDDLGGTIGADYDILYNLGQSRRFSRPDWVNRTATVDIANAPWDADQHVRFAVDPDGVLHAVWSSRYSGLAGGLAGSDGDIYHATLDADGWNAPQQVNTTGTTDSGNDKTPDIAIDVYGNLYVAWAGEGTFGADYDILFSAKTGGGWTAPAAVNSYAASDSGTDLDPRLIAVPGGPLWCAWVSDYDSAAQTSNIRAAAHDSGGWHASQYVNAAFATPAQGWNLAPDIAVTFYGLPRVVWQSNVDYQNAGADFDIFSSVNGEGTWTPPEFVNDAANDGATDEDPCIVALPDGSFDVIWSADLNINGAGTDGDLFWSNDFVEGWAAPNGDPWTAPELLLPYWGAHDASADRDPHAVIDVTGDLHVVWSGSLNSYGSGTDQDILYTWIPTGGGLHGEVLLLANASAYGDGVSDDLDPTVAIDRNGRLHVGWESFASLGVIGHDCDILHGTTDLPAKSTAGPPFTESVWDNGNGSLHLGWLNYARNPAQYFGFSWDIYTGQWVLGGWNNTLWHPYPYGSLQGALTVTQSGGYHAWISNQYADGSLYACPNPWTGIVYSGTPHTPLNAAATALGSKHVRLNWKPEIYGSWHYEIIAYNATTGLWVNTTGPSGNSLWQFVFYPNADFLAGQVDLTVPSAGDYVFYIRAAGWLPPYPAGGYGVTTAAHVS